MFEIISQGLRYVFIVIIYLFLLSIIRLIYMDIKKMDMKGSYMDAAYLKVVNRLDSLDFKMDEFYVLKGVTIIGRSSKCDITIKDKFVSKEHIEIREEDGVYFLEDLNSANGTFLNGEEVHDIIELRNGDKIGVGFIQLLFVDDRG
ncbi:FHA domain-containing protein [Peptoniphilus asaccharolyticus DSM 20463]|uniref:FHA domain-containing protein n=1 Tax=Peptoniphilus asaccharolyticus DSM 20463 TaxID=573058 RepID=A0A1W1UVE2_PEPAS|nr:FHA domain-containing protein [Peptoniphilus asaccharolyticus]MBL7575259.1 FHA domain-containing protein [Peptoniphilus asaccharolyticus]SMB85115.1 FHA domain-containing protein [Peptoniphilus asaccharolyticus DSM 20463]